MAIRFKRSFTLIEVLVSMLLLGLLVILSVKAYAYIIKSSKMNEMRYLVLNRIDSEMNRLVYAYENIDANTFANHTSSSGGTWDDYFTVPVNAENDNSVRVYKTNPLSAEYGLHVYNSGDSEKNNLIEIIDKSNDPNVVNSGDIVGLLAWKYEKYGGFFGGTKYGHLSLSITYPYKAQDDSGTLKVELIDGYDLETINLKTTTLRK